MAVTEIQGKKFIQVDLGSTGGDWVMSREAVVRGVHLNKIGANDYMRFYEDAGDQPRIFQLDSNRPDITFQGRLMTRIGFKWSECSVATPANAILSIEVE